MTPPIRFAIGTGLAWIGLRTAVLVLPFPWQAVSPALLPDAPHGEIITTAAARPLAEPQALAGFGVASAPIGVDGITSIGPVTLAMIATLTHATLPYGGYFSVRGSSHAPQAHGDPGEDLPVPPTTPLPLPAAEAAPALLSPPARTGGTPQVSGSAWLFLRGGDGGPSAAPGGELGGSQAGARIAWRPSADVPVAVAARVSGPVGGEPGAEAALGVAWQPVKAAALTLTAERRVGLDRAGRNAWAAYAAGGVYDKKLPGGLRLDGYAEAGVVGARRGDLFADGGVRVGKPASIGGGGATLTVGAGLWGAAQPHVSRIDAGPQAAVRVPVGRTGITAAADWRFRLAGDARPRSGPALTVGVDF